MHVEIYRGYEPCIECSIHQLPVVLLRTALCQQNKMEVLTSAESRSGNVIVSIRFTVCTPTITNFVPRIPWVWSQYSHAHDSPPTQAPQMQSSPFEQIRPLLRARWVLASNWLVCVRRGVGESIAVVDGVLVGAAGLAPVDGERRRPGLVVKRAVLSDRRLVLVQHIRVEELAGHWWSILRGVGDVVLGLGRAGSSAATGIEGAFCEDLDAHVGVGLVAVERCVDGCVTEDGRASVSIRDGDRVVGVAVATGNHHAEVAAPLASVHSRLSVDRSAPVHTLDHSDRGRVGAGWGGVDIRVPLKVQVESLQYVSIVFTPGFYDPYRASSDGVATSSTSVRVICLKGRVAHVSHGIVRGLQVLEGLRVARWRCCRVGCIREFGVCEEVLRSVISFGLDLAAAVVITLDLDGGVRWVSEDSSCDRSRCFGWVVVDNRCCLLGVDYWNRWLRDRTSLIDGSEVECLRVRSSEGATGKQRGQGVRAHLGGFAF